jgi:hypothetical protein
MRWLPVKPGFCLPLGERLLVLVPTGPEQWAAVVKERSTIQVLYRDLPLGYAQGVGEDLARSAGNLAVKDAYWGRQAVTAAQRQRLRLYGLSEDKLERVSTRGQASDLITRIEARKVIRRLTK